MTNLETFLLAVNLLLILACIILYAKDRSHCRWLGTWRKKFFETNSAAVVLLKETARLNTALAETMGENEFYKAANVGMRLAMDDVRHILKANESFVGDGVEANYGG